MRLSDSSSPYHSHHRFGKRVAFCGTRGLPAGYGGFETAVDEISRRFVDAGYLTDVFCRQSKPAKSEIDAATHQGRDLVHVAGSSFRKLDTFVSSIQTGLYLWRNKKRYAHVYWFNNANLPGILMTWLARIPMTINTDGLEWRRAKWSWPFKAYYYISSMIVSLIGRSLVSDSIALKDFYRQRFYRTTSFIPYGIPALPKVSDTRQQEILASLNLEEGRYFLQVTRIEPDNMPLEIVKGFVSSGLGKQGFKMVSVGYNEATEYAQRLITYDGSYGVQVRNACYDKDILYTLRSNCFCYVHGNSVGGTNPALLEAMASCPRVLALDCLFSHEVLGQTGMFFSRGQIEKSLLLAASSEITAGAMLNRVAASYQWDAVAESYMRLASGESAAYTPRPLPVSRLSRQAADPTVDSDHRTPVERSPQEV